MPLHHLKFAFAQPNCLTYIFFFTFPEFTMIETSLACHKFKLSVFQPNDPKNFIKFVRREVKLLRSSLPHGIRVKGYEDRMVIYV